MSSTNAYGFLDSGELLLDQGRFAEAIEKFERAIELENEKYVPCLPLHPLPLID